MLGEYRVASVMKDLLRRHSCIDESEKLWRTSP
jgi:hypothetical protein